MKRKSIINTYQNGGSKEIKYGTPEYKEAYDQNKLASVNPYTGQLQGKDLPAFTVEAKDTRIVDAVNRGRGEFAENYMLPAAKFLGSFTPAGPAIGLMDAYESYRKGDTGSAILGAGLEALPYGLKYAARAGKGILKGLQTSRVNLNPIDVRPGGYGIYSGKKRVGDIDLAQEGDDWIVDHAFIDEPFRGKGMGKESYRQAADIVKKLGEDKTLKSSGLFLGDDAKNVWRSLVKSGEAREIGPEQWEFINKKAGIKERINNIFRPKRSGNVGHLIDIEGRFKDKWKKSGLDKLISSDEEGARNLLDALGGSPTSKPKSDKENLQNLLDHLEDVNKKMEDNIKTGANIDLTDDAGKLENLLDQGGQDALSRSIKAFRQQQADNFGTAMQQLASHGKPRTTPGSLSFNTSLGDKARQLLGDEFNAMQKYTASGLSTDDAINLASKEVMKSGKYTPEEALKIAVMGLEDASKGRSGPFDKFNLLESPNLSLKGVEESSKVGGGLLSKKNTLKGNIYDNPLLGSVQGKQFGVFGDKAPDLIGDVSKSPEVKMMMENPEKYKEALNAASGTYLKKKLERGANYFQKYEKGKPYTGLDAFQDISPYAKGGKKKSILNCM